VINIASGAVGKKGKTHISLQVERKMFIFCVHTHTHIWAKGQRNQFPLRDEESRLAAGKDDEATQTQTTIYGITWSSLPLNVVVHPELVSFFSHGDIFLFFLKRKIFLFQSFRAEAIRLSSRPKEQTTLLPNHLDFEASFLLTLHSCWCVCVCAVNILSTRKLFHLVFRVCHTHTAGSD
jgi:hypothetical protein